MDANRLEELEATVSRPCDDVQLLAKAWGIETSYEDVSHRRREASRESLLAVLRQLGAPVSSFADVPAALQDWREKRQVCVLEPVVVAWDGGCVSVTLRVPAQRTEGQFTAQLELEDGELRQWSGPLDDLPSNRNACGGAAKGAEGTLIVAKRLAIPGELGFGYHRLSLEVDGKRHEAHVICAPTRAYSPTGRGWVRSWGTFLPLHALHSERSWGAGDFGDLRRLREWVEGIGGSIVGTLPLLPAFYDEPLEFSPYSPVSRLFWNEFYLNIAEIPEVQSSDEAKTLLESDAVQREIAQLSALRLVDYPRVMALKRRVLEQLAETFFTRPSRRRQNFQEFASRHPYLDEYARFRALGERLRQRWPQWPEEFRNRQRELRDVPWDNYRYHKYVQWLAEEQLQDVAGTSQGNRLYLDLPLGVNANGYDVWRRRELFAEGVAGGCPPDIVFPDGQNWGFVPLHPQNIREDGCRYVRDFVRHQMKYAKVLRIDHMPSFHRIWWIPPGAAARDGVYVRYPAEELYAVFSLESHRHQTMIVGEDLGTVPPEVPAAMERHNFHRMYVVQYELQSDPGAALQEPPATSIASVNTHDMAPFAGFWHAHDLVERADAGLLAASKRCEEHASREQIRAALHRYLRSIGYVDQRDDAWAVFCACMGYLRDSPARIVLVNLEDLWQEIKSQNVPTASESIPNWQRKAALSWEDFCCDVRVCDFLHKLNGAFHSTIASQEGSEHRFYAPSARRRSRTTHH